MKCLFAILFVSLAIASCKDRQKVQLPEGEVPVIAISCQKKQVLKLSEFADSIELIPLETRDDNLIGWIPRIIATADRYYLSSAIGYQNKKLLVFDKQGRFIREIGKRGEGAEEYIEMEDFVITSDSVVKISEVYNMISYDLEGNFIHKVKQEDTPLEVYSLKGRTFARISRPTLQDNYSLRVLDCADKQIALAMQVSPTEAMVCDHYIGATGFTSDGDMLIYTFFRSPFIYSVDIYSLAHKPLYRIDYGKRNLSWRIFEDYNPDEWDDKLSKGDDHMSVVGIANAGNKLIVNSVDRDYLFYFGVYSKKTGKVLCGQRIMDDLYFKGNQIDLKAYMVPNNTDGDYLLWPVQPRFLLKGYHAYRQALGESKWRLFCKKYPRLVEVCGQLDEDSNPVLLKIKLKDF